MGAVAGGADEALHGDPYEAIKVGAAASALPWVGRQMIENPSIVKGITKWNNSKALSAATKAGRSALAKAAPAVTADDEKREPLDLSMPLPDAPERASGGKVDEDALVERLIKRWKSAKRETDRGTKELLKQPDAAVVRALDIAQAHL
jgi:hypothetical protein